LGQPAALAAAAAALTAAGARQGAHALAGPGEQGLSGLLEKLVQPGILANLRANREKAAGHTAACVAAGQRARLAGQAGLAAAAQLLLVHRAAAPASQNWTRCKHHPAWLPTASPTPAAHGRRGIRPGASPTERHSPPAAGREWAPAAAGPSPCRAGKKDGNSRFRSAAKQGHPAS
jgi:hypothetical protein